MGKSLKADFKGLVTAPGLLMRAEASCVEADNLLFDAPGVVRKRRGFSKLTGNAGGPVWSLFASRNLGSKVLAHVGTTSAPTQLRVGDGSTALDSILMVGSSNVTRTIAKRSAMAVSQKNHFVTADEGVARIESSLAASTQRFAGIPRGLGGFWSAAQLAAGTLLAVDHARAYRITWHLKDTDGVEMGGAPTGRMTIRNSAGLPGYTAATSDAQITSLLPCELGTSTAIGVDYFYRIWGTRTWNAATSQGDDECFLIAENTVTATDISNGYVAYLDATPDAFLTRQRALHTNVVNFPASELGAAQGLVNEDAPPPVASALAYWQDVMWYGDIEYRSRLQVRLLVTGGAGLVAGDDVSITDCQGNFVKMTASAAPASPTEFELFSGLATTQLDVEATAQAFVSAFNLEAASQGLTVRAYYVSVGTSVPGTIYIEDYTTAAAFEVGFICSRPAAFSPSDAGGLNGVRDAQPNAIAFSKPLRADAVPPINVISAGPSDARVLKLHPYRNMLLVFTDYGIYAITGRSYADFSVRPFDLGYKLMVRESVVTCDERVYAWCYEGIVEIDSGGVTVISTPIEPTVADVLLVAGTSPGSGGVAGGQSAFAALGFAVAYRYEHRVLFFYPQANDTGNLNGCCYWLNFDTRTRAWSSGRLTKKIGATYFDNRACGVVRFADDRLTLGNWSTGADTFLFLERRDYAATDFQDTYQDGTTAAVSSSLTLQYQVPEVSGAMHWQQTVLAFDCGDYSWRPVPTALSLAYRVQPSNLTAGVSMSANTLQSWRSETPMDVRRGNRLRLGITHTTAEYFGLVGVEQSVRPGTEFIGRGES